MAYTLLFQKSDSVATWGIGTGTGSITLSSGNFSVSGTQLFVVSYNNSSAEVVKATVSGTTMNITARAQDGTTAVTHPAGAQIIMAYVPSHYSALVNGTGFASGGITAAITADQEDWHEVGDVGEPAFENSWVNYGSGYYGAAFMKDPIGFVHLRGTVKNGTMSQTIFTLPAGYRPGQNFLDFACSTGTATLAGNIFIASNGAVATNAGSNIFTSLNGITFKAA